jgi:hypothetical protein
MRQAVAAFAVGVLALMAAFVADARSCEDKGSSYENRNPPKDLEFSITPTTANLFMANTERWERMK